jgi:hypothetical protein
MTVLIEDMSGLQKARFAPTVASATQAKKRSRAAIQRQSSDKDLAYVPLHVAKGLSVLRIAYTINIMILLPVALLTTFSTSASSAVFENKFAVSEPFIRLVGSLWVAILVCSFIGLAYPREMIAILLLQIIYKALFIVVVLTPMLLQGGTAALPVGITVCFAAIVITWPLIIWRALS